MIRWHWFKLSLLLASQGKPGAWLALRLAFARKRYSHGIYTTLVTIRRMVYDD